LIRRANFGDIPRLVEIMQAAHDRSIVADISNLDVPATRGLFLNAIRAHGRTTEGGACVWVWEANGIVAGFIVGLVARYYHVTDKLCVQDLLFIADNAHPSAASALVDAYLAFAETVSDAIEVNVSVTDIIGPPERVEKLYGRKGFARSGSIWKRRIGQ